jgi:hypothetical protein
MHNKCQVSVTSEAQKRNWILNFMSMSYHIPVLNISTMFQKFHTNISIAFFGCTQQCWPVILKQNSNLPYISPCFPILHPQCSNLVANRVYWNIHKPCYISILTYQEQFGMLSSEIKSTTCISPIPILNQSHDQDRRGTSCLCA